MMSVWNHVRSCEVWCHVRSCEVWYHVMSCEVMWGSDVFLYVQIEVLNKHLFLSAKPIIYLINLSERDYIRKKNKWSAITHTHIHTHTHTHTHHKTLKFCATLNVHWLVALIHVLTLLHDRIILPSQRPLSSSLFSSRLSKIKEWIDTRDPHAVIIPFSGALESKVCSHTPSERATPTIV